MARYRSAKLKITRRLGELPGFTQKTSQRDIRVRRNRSQYGIRLEEKQKLRMNYGLSERQLMDYVKKARAMKGSTGQVLLQLIEMRLDNIVFRLGMAPSIAAARQIITHGHIIVNNKKVSVPGYACQVKDVISVADKTHVKKMVKNHCANASDAVLAPHLMFNTDDLVGVLQDIVPPEWVGIKLNDLLIVEYYSRKI